MGEWEAIYGETPIDPSQLKDRTIRTRAELNEAEAKNIRRAYVKYLAVVPSRRVAPFDLRWFQKLHREMYGDVWVFAGQTREIDLNIGVPWRQVTMQLFELIRDLQEWSGRMVPLNEQAARLHYRAVWVHPFENGNGRWARLLANIWLRQQKSPIIEWPEQNLVGPSSPIRETYIKALHDADQGDLDPLLELHRQYMEAKDLR